MNSNGIVRLSMKHSENYEELTKQDEFGTRTYYHYSKDDIIELTKVYTLIKNDLKELPGQNWLEVILQKN